MLQRSPSSQRPSSSSGRSEESIKAITQRFDLEIVFKLSLASKGLPVISSLERCINLTELDLSHNVITKIEGLDTLVELRSLNLSSNKINRVDNLWALTKLETLRLQGNLISLEGLNLNGLTVLPKLKTLYCQNIDRGMQNPACRQKGYKAAVLAKLPNLTNLDGERSPASMNYAELAEEMEGLVAHPPPPREIELPEVEPWLQASDTGSAAPMSLTMDPEFQAKAKQVLKRIDDCHAVAEVLQGEVAKLQRQLVGNT